MKTENNSGLLMDRRDYRNSLIQRRSASRSKTRQVEIDGRVAYVEAVISNLKKKVNTR